MQNGLFITTERPTGKQFSYSELSFMGKGRVNNVSVNIVQNIDESDRKFRYSIYAIPVTLKIND